MIWGGAAFSLRAASEILIDSIILARSYEFYSTHYHVWEVVSLHLGLGVYVIATVVACEALIQLATVFQHSTVSLAVDKYGRGLFEGSDRDFGQIRLPDYTTDEQDTD